jgi:hypothetical protein
MGDLGRNEAVARIAPVVLAHFGHRGLVDFRTMPGPPPMLFVTIELSAARSCPSDLTTLWSLAHDAGFRVARGWDFDAILAIEVSLDAASPGTGGVVLPFRRPRADYE